MLNLRQVECILAYHGVMDLVRKFSNWAEKWYAHIFSDSNDEAFEELDTLASTLVQTGATDQAVALLYMLYGVETDTERRKAAVTRLREQAQIIGQSAHPRRRFLAAHWLLRAGASFQELGQLDLAGRCLADACHSLSFLASEETSAPAATVVHGAAEDVPWEDWLENASRWSTVFPRQHLHAKILRRRLEGIYGGHELAELAEDAHRLGEGAAERHLRILARSVASAQFEGRSNSEHLREVRLREAQLLESETCIERPMKLFVAAALGAIFSGYHALPIALGFKEASVFLAQLEGFDIPSSLWSICSIAATAAQSLGAPPDTVASFVKSASRYRRQCAHIQPGLKEDIKESLHYSLVWYQEQVNPRKESFDGVRDHAKMFERCLRLMRQWAAELQRTQQLSESDWTGIMFPYLDHPERQLSEIGLDTDCSDQNNTEDNNRNLRKALLGRVFDENTPPSKSLFNMVPPTQWSTWLKSVEGWLRTASYPPLEEGRHYVLKTLVDVMAYCANLACMAVPPHRALPSCESLRAKRDMENRRLETYNSLHPSLIGPKDFMLARTGKITATILLSFSSESIEAGDVDTRILTETKAEALLLAEEQETNGQRREQHHFYGLAAQACFQAFTLSPRDGLDNSIFEIFEKMEACRYVIRRQQTLASASNFLQKQGLSVIQPMIAALTSLLADFAPVLTACTAEVKLCNDALGGGPQTPRPYPLSLSCSDEEQRAFAAVSRLTKWVQRSKGQAILDLTKSAASATPPAILESMRGSENAQRLLDREAVLTKQAEQSTLSDQVSALQQLDVCLAEQSQEPALADFVQWRQSLAASFEEIQALLQRCNCDVVLVDWYSCPWPDDDTIYIQTHRRGQWTLPRPIDGFKAPSLESWLQTHVDTKQQPFADRASRAALSDLASLVEPLARLTQPGETLVLCPFGRLHRVPLHAVPISADLALIERNPVVYCQSFAQLSHALGPPQPKSNKKLEEASLVCSLGDAGLASSVAPSATIASLAQQHLPRLTAINRTQVAKAAALSRLRASDLLILLGHVDFQPAAPMQSAFHLTASASVDLGAPDTRLSAADVFHAVLRRRAVVATLWRVDIADALPFLRTFVACWTEESRRTAAAHGCCGRSVWRASSGRPC